MMKTIGVFVAVVGCLMLVLALDVLGGPLLGLHRATGTEDVRVVPATEPLEADCGTAAQINAGACNLVVQEYDALAITITWFGMAMLVVTAIGVIFFFLLAFLRE